MLEEATAAISFGMENLERERQRQKAEEATKASEERYRILVESMPLLASHHSHGGEEVDCNVRWYEYTGQSPAQAHYHGWLAAVHPDDLLRIIEHILHATNEGVPYELEYRLRRAADRSYRWHLSRAVPMRNKDGQITDWFGCAIDIEELKQAQQILKEAHDEQLERHRTELAHVVRLSMMGEMATGLAHELNQPLHAVTNYASGSLMRLRKTPHRDEQLVAALEEIRKEANRAAAVARRVRRFVQKREPQFAEIAVNHLVEEAVLFSKAELDQHHVQVALELADKLSPVLGDSVQIEQVIMNLVRNAWEAMEETSVEDRRRASQPRNTTRKRSGWKSLTAGWGSAAKTWSGSLNHSLRRNPKAWAWGWPSVAPLSRPTVDAFGSPQTRIGAARSLACSRSGNGARRRRTLEVPDFLTPSHTC